MSRRITTEKFIERAKKKHGDKYGYSKVEYIHWDKHVVINCPVHGDFSQRAGDHLNGKGCPVCGRLKSDDARRLTFDEFLRRARKVHGNKYDYSKVEYRRLDEKVCITCSKHGEFLQLPNNHLKGAGCFKCGIRKTLGRLSEPN